MANPLSEYKEKRHFDKTGEPQGTAARGRGKQLRYVVQHHIASRDHYDFRLEWDGVLKSWAVPKGPSYNTRERRLAVQVEDHPLDYRNFEGTIPKGEYGGGTVMLWDEGTWRPQFDAQQGFEDGSLKIILEGERLKGKWALVRLKPKPGETQRNWLLIKERDEYAGAFDIQQLDTSITSGRTMTEIERNEKKQGAQRRSLAQFHISSPDKVLYKQPTITKGDVAKYYLRISQRMLPYMENRVLSVVRCPQGVRGACFFKKHPAGGHPGVSAVQVPTKDDKLEEYFYLRDVDGLMSEVQMNTLEFHTWGSRIETLELPDVMVFDLDPDEGLDLAHIRQGVRDLKGILDELSLVSFLKTSGGKGYHVVVPFKAAVGWDVFYTFAKNIAKSMEAQWPKRYTSNVRKAQRKGKIFIDWIRNGRGATSVAPYSIRARQGAPVSMPIAWRELDKVAPDEITMELAVKRLRRKDPWEGFFEVDQQLN